MFKGIREWLGRRLATDSDAQAHDKAKESEQQAAPDAKKEVSTSPPAATTSAYAPVLKEMREAAKWLIAALAAVAAVMLAGTQLSSIGALSTQEDSDRLRVAVGAAAVAVLGTVVGISLMSRVLTARLTTVRDVRLPVEPQRSSTWNRYVVTRKLKRLERHIEGDPGFLEGRHDISALLADTAEAQLKAMTAAETLRDATRESARDPDNESKKAELARAKADYDHSAGLRQVLTNRRSTLLQLDGYLTVRRTFVVAVGCLLLIAVVVAAALILFAWAANPPKPETENDASTTTASHSFLSPALGEPTIARWAVERLALPGSGV